MAYFGTGYANPMDREYGMSGDDKGYAHHGHSHSHGEIAKKATGDLGLSMGDFGFSFGLGPVPNVQAIAAKVRPGSKTVELVFTGAGKGSGQSQTPEYYGKKQRQALREITRANRVDFTTHSTVGIAGLAGMDQQGNFNKASKNFSLNEVKRAIEFAADVGRGGPVVVHTGEFQRSIVDADWNQKKEGPYAGKFQMYEKEEERTAFRVVDVRSGGLIAEARKNKKVSRPVWKRYDEHDEYWQEHGGKEYKDESGNTVKQGDYIDYFGNKIDHSKRVPVYDSETGQFKTKQYGWGELKEEAQEQTKRAQKEFENWDTMSKEEKKSSLWRERIEQAKKEGLGKEDIVIRPEEAYIIATLETNAAHARGWGMQYSGNFGEEIKVVKKLQKARKFYEEIEKSLPEEERWKMMQKTRDMFGLGDIIPPEEKLTTEIIDQQLKQLRHRMDQTIQAASSQFAQAEEAMETIRHVQSAESYALKEAYDAYADLGISAMRNTERLVREGKVKKPIAIAMENLFPESYGAHPDELKKLVLGSREAMKRKLVQNLGVSEEEAERRARQHITSTLDTGHLNIWRKYWVGDTNKTIEENDRDFNKWAVQKVRELARDKIIGHVHIDDNYGYHDDHLAPGEGNTPIRGMIEALKKEGYDGELIVEPGADFTNDVSGFHSVLKTWRHFDLPVYGRGSGGQATWGQVQYGFFGQTQPPYFIFGGYSPSEDFTLWSGVPLE